MSYEFSQLSALAGSAAALGDLVPVVDISDMSTPPAGTGGSTKHITMQQLAIALSRLHGPLVNVQDYGATGNGTTDDTAAIQAAVTAALAFASGSATVYFPPGTYLCSSSLNCTSAAGSGGYGVLLAGAGRQASTIKKNFSGALVTYNGSGGYSSNPTVFGGTANITLSGDGTHTGALLQTNSAQQMHFLNTNFISNPDLTLDLAGMEDCYWTGCTSNNCGSATAPVISMYSVSANTANMLWFTQLRIEAFASTAVKIGQGAGLSGSGNNGFFFSQCKFETTTVHGDFIVADASVQQLILDQCFFALDSFASGYSTPANCVTFGGASGGTGGNQFSLTNSWVHNATGTLNAIVSVNGSAGAMGGAMVVRNVFADGTPVTSAMIFNNVGDAYIRWADVITGGTLVTGDGSWFVSGEDNSFNFDGGFAFQGTLTPSAYQPAVGGYGTGLGASGTTANTTASVWAVFNSAGTLEFEVTDSGTALHAGVVSHNGGTDTSGTATYSTPTFTSGTAKQLSTTQDVELYVFVKTAISVTLSIGPTGAAADSIVPAATLPVGAMPRIKVPKGWYVKLTCATMADLQLSQVTC